MLQYGGKLDIKLDVYSAGDLDSAGSTSGYTTFVGTSLIYWASCRQPVIAKSTTEAEYIAANEAGLEGVWFHSFLEELGYPQTSATALYIDNQVRENSELLKSDLSYMLHYCFISFHLLSQFISVCTKVVLT